MAGLVVEGADFQWDADFTPGGGEIQQEDAGEQNYLWGGGGGGGGGTKLRGEC